MATDKKRTMSDIPTLQWLVDWANVGIVFALVASLVAGGASIVFSKRVGTLKDEQYAKEKQASDERVAALIAEAENAKKERAQADLKIEEARERSAKADKVAGEANERAGALELKAQDLAKQNLDLKAGVAGLEKDAANSKLAYLELQERMKPRTLAIELFRSTLAENLKFPFTAAWGAVRVLYQRDDPEAFAFAEQIRTALLTSGAIVPDFAEALPANPSIKIAPREPAPALKLYGAGAGVTMLAPRDRSVEGTPEFAITKAFAICGFELRQSGFAPAEPTPEILTIIVGPKP